MTYNVFGGTLLNQAINLHVEHVVFKELKMLELTALSSGSGKASTEGF